MIHDQGVRDTDLPTYLQTWFVRYRRVAFVMLTFSAAILKINGEKLLKIQDDGQFIQYVVSTPLSISLFDMLQSDEGVLRFPGRLSSPEFERPASASHHALPRAAVGLLPRVRSDH